MRQKIMKYIENHKKEHGYAPVQNTIAKAFNVNRQNINYYFSKMEDQLKKYPEYKRYFDKVKKN